MMAPVGSEPHDISQLCPDQMLKGVNLIWGPSGMQKMGELCASNCR